MGLSAVIDHSNSGWAKPRSRNDLMSLISHPSKRTT